MVKNIGFNINWGFLPGQDILSSLSELATFLRPKICIPLSCTGITSFLLFNSPSPMLAFLVIACSCLTMGGYSFNLITDKEEDLANKGKINRFAANHAGIAIVAIVYASGASASFLVSNIFFMQYSIIAFLSIAYSWFRLKEVTHLKNFYTAIMGGAFFYIGALSFSTEILVYSVIMAAVYYNLSLLGDLRDFKGDWKAGIRTVPTCLGYNKSKHVASATLIGLMALVILFNASSFYLLLVIGSVSLFILVKKNMPKMAHYNLMLSIIMLTVLSATIGM